ncbi:hypothetical protein L596_019722 [Steinernema carpocapsae]|uniref:Saposin B-type domain-containing protein n=1 Tax=Steinernema carpocapsae TaxID=34508 RepID=A0A4V6A0P6_STECR|nr:hypothetical protein L596_019722 [Steinernema carpocapsae]
MTKLLLFFGLFLAFALSETQRLPCNKCPEIKNLNHRNDVRLDVKYEVGSDGCRSAVVKCKSDFDYEQQVLSFYRGDEVIERIDALQSSLQEISKTVKCNKDKVWVHLVNFGGDYRETIIDGAECASRFI